MRMVVAGGRDSLNSPLDSVEIFNSEKKIWEFGPRM